MEGKREGRGRDRNTQEWVEERRNWDERMYMREERIAEEGRGGEFYDGRRTHDDVWTGHGYGTRRER